MSTHEFTHGYTPGRPPAPTPRSQLDPDIVHSPNRDAANIEVDRADSISDPYAANSAPSVNSTEKGSILELFINGFFKRENIRWIAVVGAAIVVASSLMLVTREWSAWPLTAKYLAILGYTGLCYLFSELGRKHFGLQITSSVLQLLTLLLLPMCFLSLSWLFSPSSFHWSVSGIQWILYLIPTISLTWYAGSKIFDHLWRRRQATYLGSFVLLCIAGAMPRLESPWIAAMVTLALWAIATIGTIKINRHVFWLMEENRQPRVFGFFPIALLGLQFTTLVITKTSHSMPIEWMGFGLVLVAATILLTTRAVAEVYRQRTGGVIMTLPLHLIVPLIVGIAVTMFGVIVSFYGFTYGIGTTYAVVPTAFLASFLMLRTAQDTKKQAFVWLSLIFLLVGYQCAPTLVSGLVQQLKTSAAMAIGENRLPFAFYGLTYLPLAIALVIASRMTHHRGHTYLSLPTKYFVICLSVVLSVLSWTHVKAIFPVAVIQILLYAWMAHQLSDRRLAVLSLASLTVAAGSWIVFGNAMGFTALADEYAIPSLSILAFGLMISPWIDRGINALPIPGNTEFNRLGSDRWMREITFHWGLLLTGILLASWWVMAIQDFSTVWKNQESVTFAGPFSAIRLVEFAILGTNLWSIAWRQRNYLSGLCFWLFWILGGSLVFIGMRFELKPLVEIATFACVSLSLTIRYAWNGRQGFDDRSRSGKLSRQAAILLPLHDVCVATLVLLCSLLYLPSVAWTNFSWTPMFAPIGVITIVLWLFLLHFVHSHDVAGTLAKACLPLITAALVISFLPMQYDYPMVHLIWSLSAILLAMVQRSKESWCSKGCPTTIWFGITLTLSFLSLSNISTLTAVVSIAGIVMLHWNRMNRQTWTLLSIVGNLQALLAIFRLFGNTSWHAVLNGQDLNQFEMPLLMLGVVVSLAIWDMSWSRLDPLQRELWTVALRILFVILLIVNGYMSLHFDAPIALILVTLGAAIVVELAQSVRKQSTDHIWVAVGIGAIAIGWLVALQVLTLGSGTSQILLILAAIVFLAINKWIHGHRSFGYACPVLETLGLAAPAAAIALAMWHGFVSNGEFVPGVDSLVVLASAAVYFHRGVTRNQAAYTILAGLTVNIASALLWTSLDLYDLQLYLVPFGFTLIGLVELLKVEMPTNVRTGLRYIGALTILVSPVFEILQNSWLHLLTLLVLCVLLILLAIGLRLRPLLNTSTAFLLADLVGMVIRSANDHPGLLWIGGLVVGVAVIALAAICENQREKLLARLRMLSSELATWN